MFYSVIQIEPFREKIHYKDKLFFIGSCFSNEIANKFSQYKFNVVSNPFGTLYNPVSIFQSLERIVNKKYINANDFFLDDDIYKSFDFHSSLSGTKINELVNEINLKIDKSFLFLKEARWIFITYGSSYVYEHILLNKIVANCHKRPSSEFKNRLLSFDEVFYNIEKTINILKLFNNQLNIVFTISPVRYLKHGAFENQVSKSLLFLSIKKLREKKSEILYFPSYEIFIDELRDYRFYTTDLIHPSDVAINYVWNRLKDVSFSEETLNLLKKVQEIISCCTHRPMYTESNSYKKFKNNLLEKIKLIEKQYPFLNFDNEKSLIV